MIFFGSIYIYPFLKPEGLISQQSSVFGKIGFISFFATELLIGIRWFAHQILIFGVLFRSFWVCKNKVFMPTLQNTSEPLEVHHLTKNVITAAIT